MDDMDKVILWEGAKRLAWIVGLGLISAAIMFFAVIGVYDAIWNVPAKVVEIAELTDSRDAWRARAKELDKYIETREGQYRVATKCDQLWMMVADPNQVMDFEGLEEYLKSKKAFFKRVKK